MYNIYTKEYTILENYFGQEIMPYCILENEYTKAYICLDNNNNFQVYNENGEGAMELSNIDIEEFIDMLNIIQKRFC